MPTTELLVERRLPDALALGAYERLLLGVPHLRVEGLWAISEQYFIVCPEVRGDEAVLDKKTASQLLSDPSGWPAPPVSVVEHPPAGARRVPTRTVEAMTELRGCSRIPRDIFVDLSLVLGAEFPRFSLVLDHGDGLEIHVERSLEASDIDLLRSAAEALDEPLKISVVHPSTPADSLTFYRAAQGDLTLRPSRAMAADIPRKVRWLIEEDEDFWVSHRKEAFLGSAGAAPSDMLPSSWNVDDLRCVVDAGAFPAANLRSYLTLFDTVFLALPFEDQFDEALALLGAKPQDLVDLVSASRLKVLLPQSIDRYPSTRLAEILEANPEAVVASRRLACGVLTDTRRRVPFLHPPFEMDERRLLLQSLDEASRDPAVRPDLRRWFRVVAEACRESWHFAPLAIQRDGAMETGRFGIGWLTNRLRTEFTGEDCTLEIMGASAGVEWAACLGAHVFPRTTGDYSEEAACTLLAAMTSPLGPQGVPVVDPRVHGIVDGLLAIDSDAPLKEFATHFRGGDIERFRALVTDLAKWNQDEGQLQVEVERFNAEVRRYERRPNRLRTMSVASLVAATAAEAAPVLPPELKHLAHLPLGVWLLGTLIGRAAEATPKSALLGSLWDRANGLLAQAPAKSVLVSRLRQQLSVLRK